MRYYLAGFSAFALWGFSSLAVKPLSDYASLDILFYRVLFSFLMMVFLGAVFRRRAVSADIRFFRSMEAKAKKRVIFLTFIGGILLTSNWFFFIFLINHISIKAASFSYLVCPIVTMVLASVFLKERLTTWQWVAVGFSALGCWLLSVGHWEDVFYSLIVAFSYGGYLVSQRANRGFDSLVMLTLHVAVAFGCLLVLSVFYSFSFPIEPVFYQYMSVLVLLLTIVPLSLNLFALKGISSSSLGMLLYVNPVINFVLAITYFEEGVSTIQLVSYLIIVLSIVLFNKDLFLETEQKSYKF